MRVAATRTLPSCINSNIAPVAFFESRGAPGDYAGGVVAGLVNNYIRQAARALCKSYDTLSDAMKKMFRMAVEESPVVEIITCCHLLQQLEALCPSFDFGDLDLTVGDVLHELNCQSTRIAGSFGRDGSTATTYRMVVCQRIGGNETPLMLQVFGDPDYDPELYQFVPHNGDPTRKFATVVFKNAALATKTASHGFRNRRARNGIHQYVNRAFYKHLVGATFGKDRPYIETGVQREFTIEHLGGGVWAQKDYHNNATFMLPEGTVFRDWSE
jgi:hypothetical protein